MSKTLDRLDIALLNLLQQNNVATADALAQSVPLSPSAITRRIRRLREDGLIARDIAMLGPSLVERRLRALVRIQLHDHASAGGLGAFREALQSAREVQFCAEISGDHDLAAIVVTRDMAAFNAFADRMFAENPAVRRYETSFIKKEVKNLPAIWLDEDDIAR